MSQQSENILVELGGRNISAVDILDNVHHGIIATDLEGIIRYWNAGSEELFGYSKDEVIGKKASMLYPASKRESFKSDLSKVSNGEMITGQWLGRRKDGSWVWVDVETRLLTGDKGNPIGIIGSACDIDPQKKVEEQLEESEARAKAILQTTVDAIVTINTKGIILSFNSAAEKMFGYSEEEAIGENVKILMPSPHYENHDNYLENYLRTGEKKIIGIGREVRGKRKDGSIFPMELAVSEVTWGDERIFTGIIKDISERRSLENKIIEISDEERRRIGQDLHDGLGQMLTGISLMSQNLARKMDANGIPGAGEVQQVTEMIKEADQYARTLSHNLIPVELDAGGLKIALEGLCDRAEKLFDIKCRFNVAEDTNIESQNISIHLYRIAQEAINNAVKHGKASTVEVYLDRTGRGISLKIEDNGVGFSKTSKQASNDGMGVNTMRYRAHISGGELQIRETDKGTTTIECEIPFLDD